jgi:hypothetical protein
MTIVPIVKLDIEKIITPKCHRDKKNLQHEMCKIKNNNIIETNEDLKNVTNNDDIILYWYEKI